MAAELLHNRNRALALAAAIALHGAVIAILLLFVPGYPAVRETVPDLISVDLREPPAPAPDNVEQGANAPPSRGASEAPSPSDAPRPLASPIPAVTSADVGFAQASGSGSAPGSGAGQGGEGAGQGAGTGGSGAGSGRLTPPVRIAGELTNADYHRVRPPEGASGTVVVSFRVDIEGRVDRCHAIRSSGYAVFDQATCRLIQTRFRYRPAIDASGRPIAWNIRTEYTWEPR